MNNPLKLKSFDILIWPILTLGSEIWVTYFKTNENTLDSLPSEKYKTDSLSIYWVFTIKLQILQPDLDLKEIKFQIVIAPRH